MKRFFTYWQQYLPLSHDDKQFIQQHARIHHYRKGQLYLVKGEAKFRWCFVLDGLVAGTDLDRNDRENIYWLVAPFDYFGGTKHLFSKHSEQVNIRFFQDSQLLEISAFTLQEALGKRPVLAELIQILKQHKLNQHRHLLRILKLAPQLRFEAMINELPQFILPLTVQRRTALLGISKDIYYQALAAFLRKKQ